MSKRILVGVAIVAAGALGDRAGKGAPQLGEGTEGTVGAAKRYQTEQISKKDVTLEGAELRYLERAIGPTGLLAMKPIRRQSSRDLWQLHALAEAETS